MSSKLGQDTRDLQGQAMMPRTAAPAKSPFKDARDKIPTDMDEENTYQSGGEMTQKEIQTPQLGKDLTQREYARKKERERGPYPNHSDDREPLPEGATKKILTAHAKVLRDYSHEEIVVYKKTRLTGEILWRSFITTFRPSTIHSLPRAILLEWLDLLTTREVFFDTDRTRPVAECIIDVLYRKDHVKAAEIEVGETTVIEKEGTVRLGDGVVGIDLNANGDRDKNVEPDENSKNSPTNDGKTPNNDQTTHRSETSRKVVRFQRDDPADPGDDGNGSDDSDRSSRLDGHHGGERNNEPKEGYKGHEQDGIETKGRQGQATEH